jgi:hypothetical protein
MDSTVRGIRFDGNGICNFCRMHDQLEQQHPLDETGKKNFEKLIAKIKKDGKDKEYDCIVGVSGGRDSTYAVHRRQGRAAATGRPLRQRLELGDRRQQH